MRGEVACETEWVPHRVAMAQHSVVAAPDPTPAPIECV
jgi:hypothetical protein